MIPSVHHHEKRMILYTERAHNNAYALLLNTYNAAYQYCAKHYDAVHAALNELYDAVSPN